jgi:hypothetical protein
LRENENQERSRYSATPERACGDKQANWLPAPKDDFEFFIRAYGSKDVIMKDQWSPRYSWQSERCSRRKGSVHGYKTCYKATYIASKNVSLFSAYGENK